MFHSPRVRLSLGFPLIAAIGISAGFLASPPANAFEDKRECCRIIRVDGERHTAWLRNPRTAVVVELLLGEGDRELFEVGDLYNPETGNHNGVKLDRSFRIVLPRLDPPNARLLRARGHEFAAKDNESDVVYRSRTLRFDNTLSSLRPGQDVYVDAEAGWFFIEVQAHGNVKPSVWAYKLE